MLFYVAYFLFKYDDRWKQIEEAHMTFLFISINAILFMLYSLIEIFWPSERLFVMIFRSGEEWLDMKLRVLNLQ